VLVVGGSLGARSVNEAIAGGIDAFVANDIQVIWQTGKTDADKWKDAAESKTGIRVNDFISKMEMAYAASDVVVSRAGAMAVAELCMVKKPVVFVPYPFAAEDHQTMNARNLVEKNAALMVKDSEAKDKLVKEVMNLIKDRERQETLKQNIGQHAVADASEKIAEEIIKKVTSRNV
jgi:UDP-N-acetylglucosamine--N-acetylmuramyl-(pentapeptide) pyrophosphoryl-undecaprenol N-acetylglucosamine transferase